MGALRLAYPMDVMTLLRCTFRTANRAPRGTARKIFCLAAMMAVAGCAQVPPEYDPVNWVSSASRDVSGWFGDKPQPAPPIVEPPPAEGRPFPNLGTVPPAPLVTTGQRTQREAELTRLQADRAAAAKADAALRARTGGTPAQSGAPPAAGPGSAGPAAPAASAPASTSAGAAPAPIVELPSLPSAQEQSATAAKIASLLTTSERRGSVSFAPDATSVSAAGRNTLDAAAAAALENAGSVRLVPAEIDGADVSAGLVERRTQALRDALAGAGLPKDRIMIANVGVRRVDVYDVYVDY